MNRILFVYPDAEKIERFYNDSRIVFLDKNGWSIIESSKRVYLPFDFAFENSIEDPLIFTIIDRLNWWLPIWNRWAKNLDQYEILKFLALMQINSARSAFKSLNIASALFFTGISHHIDMVLIEIACAISKINQIFLYSNVVNGRLIPMLQVDSIFDRKPLNAIISNHDSSVDVDKFIKNLYKKRPPVANGVDTSLSKNFYAAIGFIIKKYTLLSIIELRNLVFKKSSNPLSNYLPLTRLSFFDNLRLLIQQKKAINFYDKNVVSKIDKIKYLIIAHFQPEATSFPEGGHYSNHVNIVMKLRSLGIDNLAYKEHPSTWTYFAPIVGETRVAIYRSLKYYEQIQKLGCSFVSQHLSANSSFDNSKIIPITITGTIAIERSLLGYSTIVCGEPWYLGLPGTIHINSLKQNDDYFETIEESNEQIKAESRKYLNSILSKHTLINTTGIATGKTSSNPLDIKIHNDEFDLLVEHIFKLI
jgi:hypothetical protein